MEEYHYVDHRELAIEPVRAGLLNVPSFVLMALVMLATGSVLSATIYREVP